MATKEQGWFARLGRWLEKAGGPASRVIERLYARWLTPLNDSKDWVTEADWARLQQEPLRARALLYVMALVLLLLLVWAAFASVDEVARGEGRVIPSRQLQVIQSFDGGVVDEILVHEGQVVEAGDLLLRIDPTRFISSFRESRAQYLSLQAKAERLKALTSGAAFVLPSDVMSEAPDVAAYEQRLFETSLLERAEQLRIARDQQVQREEEYKEIQAKVTQTTRAHELARQELQVTRPLLASGAISEVEILRLEGDVSNADGARKQALAQLARSEAAVAEAAGKLREVELTINNKWRNELSEVMGKLASLEEGSRGLADRIKYAEIRSPVRGTVQRLLVNTVGGVVQPGNQVLEIIPLDDQLLIEAKVAPKDIAFLRPGQPAIVKFTAYDFVVYGGLTGTLEHISADTITDERDNTFYLVRVRTDRAGFDPALPIMPGMTTQVDILTGKKTVLAYLLKPVLRAQQNALTER
ncbi:HlyD family type I secretion periplasmic adaptor subunit [Cellvibrio sp. ARAG 10.3]|uniref:HlyD family type I secretion periplasmic adaptor subunit n=1 Tax=Cellvibrio sp. ARAG 10.3 TaxID=3451358 RepID=UPI003F4780FA